MPRAPRRKNPAEDILQQMLVRDMKMLERAKVLAAKPPSEDADLTPGDLHLAEAARTAHNRVPFFLHDAAEMRTITMKREESHAEKPPVFIVVADPLSIEAWERQAHALQAQHENERLHELVGVAVDVESTPVVPPPRFAWTKDDE